MTIFNQPRLQFGPVAWGLFCIFGLAFGGWQLFRFSPVTEPWLATLLLMGIVATGFLAIEGWWIASQREVRVGPRSLVVRKWMEMLLGWRGRTIALSDLQAVRLVLRGGKMLELETDREAFRFWVALWSASDVHRLLEVVQARGVPVATEWQP